MFHATAGRSKLGCLRVLADAGLLLPALTCITLQAQNTLAYIMVLRVLRHTTNPKPQTSDQTYKSISTQAPSKLNPQLGRMRTSAMRSLNPLNPTPYLKFLHDLNLNPTRIPKFPGCRRTQGHARNVASTE